jgi:hypothetical protein
LVEQQVLILQVAGSNPATASNRRRFNLIIHKCKGCGHEAVGKTEIEAESKFNMHLCPSMERIKSLSMEELCALVTNRNKTKGMVVRSKNEQR